jgi:hypothetical protein
MPAGTILIDPREISASSGVLLKPSTAVQRIDHWLLVQIVFPRSSRVFILEQPLNTIYMLGRFLGG